MAWPNPFRRRDENTRTCWGYTFQLTKDHLTAEASQPLKFSYDKLGEECLNILNVIDPPAKPGDLPSKRESQDSEASRRSKPKRDLYKSLEAHAGNHPRLQELWTQSNNVPEWVNWDQVRLPNRNISDQLTTLRYPEVRIPYQRRHYTAHL
jgi:hypothetical protein